jgi:hypothetical protein
MVALGVDVVADDPGGDADGSVTRAEHGHDLAEGVGWFAGVGPLVVQDRVDRWLVVGEGGWRQAEGVADELLGEAVSFREGGDGWLVVAGVGA